MEKELITGIIFIALGTLFFFNNKNIGEGAFKFYKWFYTKKRLKIMFKATGIILMIGGLILMLFK